MSFFVPRAQFPEKHFIVIVFNERMKSQASLHYNEVVNVNSNLKGDRHGKVLHWSRCT
jgi:hypothetical protein